MDSLSSSSSSTTKMKNKKLSVRNQTRFKNTNLLSREKTMLKKALELSILCDNEICVLHYDLEGNLVNTLPQDQSQVSDILQRYKNLSDREKLKKNTNLSQFCNKKLIDDKKRSLTNANEHKAFTKKVGEFKGSLEYKLLTLQDRFRDLLDSQDHHQTEQEQSPCLGVMSEQTFNFTASSGFNDLSYSLVEEDSLMNFGPHDIDQQQQQETGGSLMNLLMSGDHHVSTSTDQQYLLSSPSSSTVCSQLNHQSKFSVFLYNHETATFTQLPNSVTSSFDQGLIGTY